MADSFARGVQREGGRPGPAVVAVGEEGDRAVVGDGEPEVAPFPAGDRLRLAGRSHAEDAVGGAVLPGRRVVERAAVAGEGVAHRMVEAALLAGGEVAHHQVGAVVEAGRPVVVIALSPLGGALFLVFVLAGVFVHQVCHPGAAVRGQPKRPDLRHTRLRQVGQVQDQQGVTRRIARTLGAGRVHCRLRGLDQRDQKAVVGAKARIGAPGHRHAAPVLQVLHHQRGVAVPGHEPVDQPAAIAGEVLVLDLVPDRIGVVVKWGLLLRGERERGGDQDGKREEPTDRVHDPPAAGEMYAEGDLRGGER